MSRIRRIAAVIVLTGLLAILTSGCIVVGRPGCGQVVVSPFFRCADFCFRACR